MSFGIIVYETFGRYYPFTMADDSLYDSFKEGMHKYDMNFLRGRKGISDVKIDKLANQVCELVRKANETGSLDLEKELANII